MNVGYLTIGLVVLGMVACGVGAFGIAKYAFRISSGKGALAFLFPPYTFYFSFVELQEDGKEMPIAIWLSGLFVTILITVAFWQPINMVFQGKADQLYPPAADEMEKQFGQKPVSAELSKPIADLEVQAVQAPETNNAVTNGAGTNNTADTNNGAAATNGAQTNNAPATP